MKKICIISDTHSFFDNNMKKYFIQSDEVWHAGDIGDVKVTNEIKKHSKLKAVYGNIDDHKIRNEFTEYIFFNCENCKILITHISGQLNKYNFKTINLFNKYKPDVFICGHSHILKIMYNKKFKFLHINPGAIGKHGIHKVRTMVTLKIENKKIFDLNIIEIKR